jgi:hypothetical protein
MTLLPQDFKDFLKLLHSNQVEYLLIGDRYHQQQGTFSTHDPMNDPGRALTLIENEAIEQFNLADRLPFTPRIELDHAA